ncbi:MAG: hypothetical protein IKU27_08865 [Clostridia bacterium]|nr:hypothetical protein [Clostridia bacterium]
MGINKIIELLRTPNCPFVLFVGSKNWSSARCSKKYIENKLVIWFRTLEILGTP